MTTSPSASPKPTLPASTHTGQVHLRVADLDSSLAFYRDMLGYHVENVGTRSVQLAPKPEANSHFQLDEAPGVSPKPWKMAGLFHAAIRIGSRPDLARTIKRLVDHGWPVPGTADHGVSEAFYLNDPDSNGLEIYADRPRDQWPYSGGTVQMVTDPLDLESLFSTVASDSGPDESMPVTSDIGHVHLQVSDLARAERFYVEILGFDVTQRSYGGALFVSAGGYHHHVGLNVWAGRNVSDPSDDVAGLIDFTVLVPDVSTLEAIEKRLADAGVPFDGSTDPNGTPTIATHDLDGIGVVVRVDEGA
ncbi:MAG: VOC family protein [Nitrolancea sp.]